MKTMNEVFNETYALDQFGIVPMIDAIYKNLDKNNSERSGDSYIYYACEEIAKAFKKNNHPLNLLEGAGAAALMIMSTIHFYKTKSNKLFKITPELSEKLSYTDIPKLSPRELKMPFPVMLIDPNYILESSQYPDRTLECFEYLYFVLIECPEKDITVFVGAKGGAFLCDFKIPLRGQFLDIEQIDKEIEFLEDVTFENYKEKGKDFFGDDLDLSFFKYSNDAEDFQNMIEGRKRLLKRAQLHKDLVKFILNILLYITNIEPELILQEVPPTDLRVLSKLKGFKHKNFRHKLLTKYNNELSPHFILGKTAKIPARFVEPSLSAEDRTGTIDKSFWVRGHWRILKHEKYNRDPNGIPIRTWVQPYLKGIGSPVYIEKDYSVELPKNKKGK